MTQEYSRIQCDFIYPAPQMLLDRECKQEKHIITETPEIYQKYTKPLFIDKVNPSDCQWVENILNKSKEVELTVFRNELFTLQLDFEYN